MKVVPLAFLSMNNSNDLISNIEEKVIQLLTYREKDKKELKKIQEKIVELQNIIKEKDIHINQLENQNQLITQSSEKGNRNVDIRNRIDDILREVDKCMGMLNS
jgi:flagellar biosynthesis/type III secretory pathway chaperone